MDQNSLRRAIRIDREIIMINRQEYRNQILQELANAYGIQTVYYDVYNKRQKCSDKTIICALKALDVIEDENDLASALSNFDKNYWHQKVEPVIVVWNESLAAIPLRITQEEALTTIHCHIHCEDGQDIEWNVDLSLLPIINTITIDSTVHLVKIFQIRKALPFGYHKMSIRILQKEYETLLLSAPRHIYQQKTTSDNKCFGLFVPLYALHSERSFGCGDLSDLRNLISWTIKQGGKFISTLPIHAAFLEEPCEISPYSPVSRLFWNELYLDITSIQEFENEVIPEEVASLNNSMIVDYKRIMQLKRPILERMAIKCMSNFDRRNELEQFLTEYPEVKKYAKFRAFQELTKQNWRDWSSKQWDEFSHDLDKNRNYLYHVYVQWQMQEQLNSINQHNHLVDFSICMNLPIGVHRDGYDTWQYQSEFALKASVGAPPDMVFPLGQDWGFPPLNPLQMHKSRYQFFIHTIRTIMKQVDILNIDHVMGLHRLYWIPEGCDAKEGVYIRYPVEELYAILCIESNRNQVAIVGENLGTVPKYLNKMMNKHHLQSLYVVLYELDSDREISYETVPEDSLSSLNTHDMPTFAAYVKALDVQKRKDLGLIKENEIENVMRERNTHLNHLQKILVDYDLLKKADNEMLFSLLTASLLFLAKSNSYYLVINVEDLWLETKSQNIPTAGNKELNWQRKTRLKFEDFINNNEVTSILQKIAAVRPSNLKTLPDVKPQNIKIQNIKSTKTEQTEASFDKNTVSTLTGEEYQMTEPGVPYLIEGINTLQAKHTIKKTTELFVDIDEVIDSISNRVRRFSLLSKDDVYWFNEGNHFHLYQKLGAHLVTVDGVAGVYFAVWAPNAKYVSVIGNFNYWDKKSHPLESHYSSGIWEGFIPDLKLGEVYKYFIHSHHQDYQVEKADPFGFYHEIPPKTASVVWDLDYQWQDQQWMSERYKYHNHKAPMSIYEIHLGSWRRSPEEGNRFLSYREITPYLVEYVKRMGYTHVELLPIMEHPYYNSWGYQTTGYFAPTSRYGNPQDFMYLIDTLHQNNIGVILDWVPSHFPTDQHGLDYFDGTHLFEHADPRIGFHPDWKSDIFNYGRNEVRAFLISSALFWLEKYHIDGFRVDAVASMLYLDYSRKEGEWIPNKFGGRENIDAIYFLRRLNEEVYKFFPDVHTIAEESTAWGSVSRPTYTGGLGFGFKWDMGWMHDTLHYFGYDAIYRSYHQNEITFRMLYAFTENYILPLSHDEVVHGKGSLLGKMSGFDWEKFANLRCLLGYMYAQPGKKLLFMGGDIGQWHEWDCLQSLDWHLLQYHPHQGLQNWVKTLNELYRKELALHEWDCEPKGFEWIDCHDYQNSTLSFLRKSSNDKETILVVFNATPIVRYNYRIGVPYFGKWYEIANSDDEVWGGSGRHNKPFVESENIEFHLRPYSINITLPPLSILYFKICE